MDEGEKSNKIKQKGDSVTFRLLKKMKYSNAVLELINKSTKEGRCNEEVIKALDFYVKYNHREDEIKLFVEFMDKLENPGQFSEKVLSQLYTQYITEKLQQENKESPDIESKEETISTGDSGESEIFSDYNIEVKAKEIEKITSDEVKNNVIKLSVNNEDTSDEEELFGSTFTDNSQNIIQKAANSSPIARAMASIQRKR